MTKIDSRFSVAPMMNWTNRHCRVFHRLLTKNTLLYSEMITAAAIIFGNRERLLTFNAIEHPLALQVGGSDPKLLSEAAKIGSDFGYDEINLNVGCPSHRVLSGEFGAALMIKPELVAKCLAAMNRATPNTKITVKCRIGIDNQDPYEVLPEFLRYIFDTGVEKVIIHARKAFLNGLSPKQNRYIPPLDYSIVKIMKNLFPDKEIVINGGIKNLPTAAALIRDGLDGVMIGREAYYSPGQILLPVDSFIFGSVSEQTTMKNALSELCCYIDDELSKGTRLNEITRHLHGAFNGQHGAKSFRRTLSEEAHKPGVEATLLRSAIERINDGGL